jgi:tRNA pseudouridine38-40 synthase
MRYKITIEYDGTNYFGWQAQPDHPNKGVEDVLKQAIFNFSGENVKINCAGRTDSGVHAACQVADFILEKDFEPLEVLARLNYNLRESDIVILSCEIVDEKFHSRFDATLRKYRYVILNRRARPILQKNRVWHLPMSLNVQKMQESCQFLVGEHDFSSFRDAKCQAPSPVRNVKSLEIYHENDEIIVEIVAKSFLHHMVRNIVGTLVLVGKGRLEPKDIKLILQSRDRTKSGMNAPSCGLYFMGVIY